MSDDYLSPDTGQLDMSPHDQTPDVSLDTAVSIREAATRANVTEKTIRRWIKSSRLHAVKMGGQYRITLADLETARLAVPDPDGENLQSMSTQQPNLGHDSPSVDMSSRLDSEHGGHGQGRQDSAPVDLAPLVEHIASLESQVQQLTATNTMWQLRAQHLEQRLQALTAGETPPETVPEPPGSTESNEIGPRGLWVRLRRWLGG